MERECFGAPWTERQIAGELEPGGWVLCAVAAADPPGAPLLAYASVRRVVDEAELLRLAVAATARRRGLANALVEHACAVLGTAGVVRLFLEVRADNEAALALYARLGFERVGRRRGYYENGTDALLLARRP